jgi:tetratricopeptide (TPR) repeat protein
VAAKNNPREALALLERCLELRNDLAELHYLRGMRLFQLSKFEEARKSVLYCIELAPDHAESLGLAAFIAVHSRRGYRRRESLLCWRLSSV